MSKCSFEQEQDKEEMHMKNSHRRFDNPAGMLYVGIDIAKEFHCARALKSFDSGTTEPLFFRNRREGFKKLKKGVKKWLESYGCDGVVIGMEPTADYWRPLYAYLIGNGFRVNLVSSLKVRRAKDLMDNSPLKSDRKDALVIAKLTKEGNLLSFCPREKEIEEVKVCVRHIEDLEDMACREENHIEHYLSVHFPDIGDILELRSVTMRKFLMIFTTPAEVVEAGVEKIRDLLKEASRGRMNPSKADEIFAAAKDSVGLPCTHAEKLSVRFHLESLERISENLGQFRKHLEELLEPMGEYHILRSIEGVGLMCSATIIADLGDLTLYSNYRQVIKKSGLNLFSLSSGNYKSREHISRRGSSFLRRNLYMAALQHTHSGSAFYDKYSRMRDSGKGFRTSMIAIMRKILKVAYTLVRDDRVFDKDHVRGAGRNEIVIRRARAA